ncbi:MAG TPA: SDR family oxidoreductase [Bacteroidia bacterium]|jgi:nucleoside-diphosphate-sugar epimerase|nr:SDR family oxidoreductase [Bacteroidia bacterium]HRG53742.1 SDR family oxidoreductase [Bacteroidia bacterium]
MKSVHSISILGCGWLGLPLAELLVKKQFNVMGSVTTAEKLIVLKKKGIIPFQLELTDEKIIGDRLSEFFHADLLIINIPPGRRKDVVYYHKAQIQQLITALKKGTIKQVIFISSSAVYPDLNKVVFENETEQPEKESGKALLEAEQLLRDQTNFTTTIIRFAGLIGPDRHPGKFLAGKQNVANGEAPVNLIHRDDCIALIAEIIEQEAWGDIFNACADNHPSRNLFYTTAAKQLALEIPSFAKDEAKFKIINSDKIKKRLKYSFKFPDPLVSLAYLTTG